jgi:predicted RNase H-like HicB family nuclease
MKKSADIRVFQDPETGILMAASDDLPGFVLHAYTIEELETELPGALESFMRASNRPISVSHVSSFTTSSRVHQRRGAASRKREGSL